MKLCSALSFYGISRSDGMVFVKLVLFFPLTLNLLTTTIFAPLSNASKWQMEFNSAFKGLIVDS